MSGKAVSAGGSETSTRVGLVGGSGDEGMLGLWWGKWCVSLDRLREVSDIYRCALQL